MLRHWLKAWALYLVSLNIGMVKIPLSNSMNSICVFVLTNRWNSFPLWFSHGDVLWNQKTSLFKILWNFPNIFIRKIREPFVWRKIFHKPPPEGFWKKRCSWKFRKFHRKTTVLGLCCFRVKLLRTSVLRNICKLPFLIFVKKIHVPQSTLEITY